MKKNNILILIVASAFLSLIVYLYILKFKPRKQRSNIKELYSEGLDMIINGNRRAAYKNFKSIIEKDTNNVNAYLRLGQVVREAGNPKRALKIHRALIIRKGLSHYEQIELCKNLSLDYYKIDNLKNACLEATNILKIDKSNEWALRQLIKYSKE